MSRKTRIRKRILVVGLGLAALAAPSAGLAGGYSGHALKALNAKSQAENNRYGGDDGYSFQAFQAIVAKGQAMNQRYGVSQYGAPDGWTPYVEQLTRQSQGGLSQQAYNAVVAKGVGMNQRYGSQSSAFNPNSPETRARLVAQGYEDGTLYRQNSTLIDGRSPDTKDASAAVQQEILDGRAQNIATFEQGLQLSRSEQVADGRSPDTRDSAALAHTPVVTITQTPSFQWGDFGIGTGVALAAVLLLAVSMRILTNRQGRKPGSVATA
jgi:hypothetical protein